jgi:hypothetical protein
VRYAPIPPGLCLHGGQRLPVVKLQRGNLRPTAQTEPLSDNLLEGALNYPARRA